MSFKCRDGKTFVNFECSLGHPDSLHIQDGRSKKKYKVKSDARKVRNNARAASFQATKFPPSVSTTPPSSVGLSQDLNDSTVTSTTFATSPSFSHWNTSKKCNDNQEEKQLSDPEYGVVRSGREYCQSRQEFDYNTPLPFSATQEESETENIQESVIDYLPHVAEYQNYMAANVNNLAGKEKSDQFAKEAPADGGSNTEAPSAEPGGSGTSSSVTSALKQKFFEEHWEYEIQEASNEDQSKTETEAKGSHSNSNNGISKRDCEILLKMFEVGFSGLNSILTGKQM